MGGYVNWRVVWLGAGIGLALFGVWLHGAGFHNVDLGWNMMRINAGAGLAVRDYSAVLGWMGGQELVGLGYMQQDAGLGLGLVGAFIAGFYAHGAFKRGGRNRRC